MPLRSTQALSPVDAFFALARSSRRSLALLGACLACTWLGCAGYQVGNRSLYAPDIQTVYVPMFESNSFRRQLGERLTEAVIKQIQIKTPYTVVNTPDADAILSGKILVDHKRILIETPTDEGREVQVDLLVEVNFLDARGDRLAPTQTMPMPSTAATIGQANNLIPEYGQSIATAQQAAIQKVAEQIVSQMENPW